MSLMARDTSVSIPRIDAETSSFDGILDSLPQGASQDEINAAVVRMITNEIWRPKKIETVVGRWPKYLNLMAMLARTDPQAFAAVTCEFAERLSQHPAYRAGRIPVSDEKG